MQALYNNNYVTIETAENNLNTAQNNLNKAYKNILLLTKRIDNLDPVYISI